MSRFLQPRAGKKAEKGQSLVELALLFPLLLLIFAGVLDMGRAYYAYVTITNAARQGAHYAAFNASAPDSTIQGVAVSEAAGSGFTISSSSVHINPGAGSRTSGNSVTVTITVDFQLVTLEIIRNGRITLSSSATMVVF